MNLQKWSRPYNAIRRLADCQYVFWDYLNEEQIDLILESSNINKTLRELNLKSKYANLKARMYAMNYDNIIWMTDRDKDIPNSFLFQISDVVITVNSSTGFEALYYEKPLIVLGDAVYKVDGVFPALKDYLTQNFDKEKYKVNIGKIRNFFLNYYLFSKEKANDSNFFFNHLKFVGDLSKKKLKTKEIIDAYYERNKKI